MHPLLVRDMGQMEYLAALSYQQKHVKQKQQAQTPDVLLLVEHPHVFTLGPSGKEKNLLVPGDTPCHRIRRGGDITYHGPGQMVAYPIIDLRSRLRRDVHRYLKNLELTLIETIEAFRISAKRRSGCTGVWIGTKKIAAIGIAVHRGISSHGVALNINTDLTFFDRIIPCGLQWAQVTSLKRELGNEVDLGRVKEVFVDCFTKRFGYTQFEQLCHEDTQTGLKSVRPGVPITSDSKVS